MRKYKGRLHESALNIPNIDSIVTTKTKKALVSTEVLSKHVKDVEIGLRSVKDFIAKAITSLENNKYGVIVEEDDSCYDTLDPIMDQCVSVKLSGGVFDKRGGDITDEEIDECYDIAERMIRDIPGCNEYTAKHTKYYFDVNVPNSNVSIEVTVEYSGENNIYFNVVTEGNTDAIYESLKTLMDYFGYKF